MGVRHVSALMHAPKYFAVPIADVFSQKDTVRFAIVVVGNKFILRVSHVAFYKQFYTSTF